MLLTRHAVKVAGELRSTGWVLRKQSTGHPAADLALRDR